MGLEIYPQHSDHLLQEGNAMNTRPIIWGIVKAVIVLGALALIGAMVAIFAEVK